MDAHAHLLSLGWAGPGHSLDSRPHLQHKGRRGLAYDPSQNNNTGRGLVKPLLVSQKRNTFGIGKKAHEPAAGNDWWLKGFENALSNIGKNNDSTVTSGTATPETGSTSGYRGKHNGLYGFFVRGQQMEGTIGEERKDLRGKKRKSDTFDDGEQTSVSSTTTTPGSSTPRTRPASKGNAAADFDQISQFLGVRDKDRRRGERSAKLDPRDDFEQMGQFFKAAAKPTKKHRERNKDVASSPGVQIASETAEAASRPEKPLAKKKKESKTVDETVEVSERQQNLSPAEKITLPSSSVRSAQIPAFQAGSSAPVDEALRRAERKRRKEQKRLAKMETDC
jgi:hypothetical protein